MKWSKFLVVLAATLGLVLGGINVAEAKRLGGGGSFGSKFGYSAPVQRKSTSAAAPSAAQGQNAERRQQLGQRGGLMGMLGGLALGGLLGALFFGGAFEGINLFDIVILAAAFFLIMKLMAARRPQSATAGGYATGVEPLSRQGGDDAFGAAPAAGAPSAGMGLDALRGEIPKDFNQAAFLDGARSCFANLQQAWDRGELGEIRRFTSDPLFAELQEMLRARRDASVTEVVSLAAELLKVVHLGATMEATVLFDAELVEDGGEEARIQEVWHFVRRTNNPDPNWQLDGIQQVAGE